MTTLSKHPKWRKLSSKDKDELKKFERYLKLLRKNGFHKPDTTALNAARITRQTYEEIYGK